MQNGLPHEGIRDSFHKACRLALRPKAPTQEQLDYFRLGAIGMAGMEGSPPSLDCGDCEQIYLWITYMLEAYDDAE